MPAAQDLKPSPWRGPPKRGLYTMPARTVAGLARTVFERWTGQMDKQTLDRTLAQAQRLLREGDAATDG
jgi:hypothetical protein